MSKVLSRVAVALAITAALFTAPASAAESDDARFLAGLRERQLFGLAETYCRGQLQRAGAQDEAQAALTIELIRTLAAHAANEQPENREALWSEARKAAAEFLRHAPRHPRTGLVRLQDALTPLAIGELARQEFEAGALAADRLEPARAALREATSLLEALDRELTGEIPLRRRTAPAKGELSGDELFSLQQHVQHQLARAQRNRALLFELGSADRIALLSAAVETLQRPLAQLAADEPLLPQIQLDLAEGQRLLGRLDEAGQLAAALDQEGVPPPIRLRARAELLRLAIARANPAAIQRLLDERRSDAGESSAELDFAFLEAQLALARLASEGKWPAASAKPAAEISKEYQDRAAATATLLEETYGTYWGRRADQLLVTSLPRGSGRGNLQLLARAADSLYVKGELDQAIAAYDEAAAQARADGDLNAAFDLAYKAALAEQRRKKHIEAANRLRILSKSFATHAQAPPAHLLAAWNAAQVASASPAAVNSYATILREHLATWPAAETGAQARVWLGKLKESQAAWEEAIEAYNGVPRSSPHFAAAIVGLARAWPQRLAELAAAGKPTGEAAAEAIQTLESALVDDANKRPQQWTETDRAVALAAAELIVAYQPSDAAEAIEFLEAAVKQSEESPAEWKAAANLTLTLAAAELPARRGEALASLAKLAKENPDSAAIQEKYADLLLAAGQVESLKLALDRWRMIASRSKPRTPRWYKAKYSVALAQYRLNDRAGAATLLKYLLETPPGLNGTEWEARCTDLLRQCEKANPP